MTGKLGEALTALLTQSLPGLLGGDAPPVTLSTLPDSFILDTEKEPEAGEPRIDDRIDLFPFHPATPAGPYTLTRVPSPGPRRIYLTSSLGGLVPVPERELRWEPADSRKFTLHLCPERDVSGFDGVRALYGAPGIFVKVEAVESFGLQLTCADPALLEKAEALVTAVIALHRTRLVEESGKTFEDGSYGAQLTLKALHVQKGTVPGANSRLLQCTAEVELKATRALGAEEGRPIERILTPGQPVRPRRSVDIRVEVES